MAFEVEQDPTLIGEVLERWITKWMPKTAAKVKANGCNCDQRKNWLNDKHEAWRDWLDEEL
jgi:hypothetical protein